MPCCGRFSEGGSFENEGRDLGPRSAAHPGATNPCCCWRFRGRGKECINQINFRGGDEAGDGMEGRRASRPGMFLTTMWWALVPVPLEPLRGQTIPFQRGGKCVDGSTIMNEPNWPAIGVDGCHPAASAAFTIACARLGGTPFART